MLDRGPEAVPERVLPPFALVDALPPSVVEQARFWEQHVVEVLTGLRPDAPEGMSPRPEYDPAWRTLMEREAAKVAELAAGGQQISKRTFLRMRQRYEAEGLRGLVDGRSRKPPAPVPGTGRTDERVVEAVTEALAGQTDLSTGDRKRLMLQAEQILAAKHGEEAVKLLPTRATFYRPVSYTHPRATSPSGRPRSAASGLFGPWVRSPRLWLAAPGRSCRSTPHDWT